MNKRVKPFGNIFNHAGSCGNFHKTGPKRHNSHHSDTKSDRLFGGVESSVCDIRHSSGEGGIKNSDKNHPAREHITTNILANIFGLGWAATPAGLKAMESLKSLEDDRRKGLLPGPVRKRRTASNEMCTFLILNI